MSTDSLLELLFFVGAFSAAFATFLSGWLINKHISNLRSPHLQTKIIGILWMVPIYSFNSTMSLLFPASAAYIDMARDCYEAYVLYLFFALLLAFLSGGDEEALIETLEISAVPRPVAMFPFNLCVPVSPPSAREFLRGSKFGILQYCVVRPAMAVLTFILSWMGGYEEGSFSPLGFYLYICIATNVSIAFAFSNLLSFYHVFHDELRPLRPMPKFVCIKSIIFCIFWQGVLVALLVDTDVIRPPSGSSYDDRSVATALQDLLVCFEMSVAAVANLYAFDYRPFSTDYDSYGRSRDDLKSRLGGSSRRSLGASLLGKDGSTRSSASRDPHRQRLPHSGSKKNGGRLSSSNQSHQQQSISDPPHEDDALLSLLPEEAADKSTDRSSSQGGRGTRPHRKKGSRGPPGGKSGRSSVRWTELSDSSQGRGGGEEGEEEEEETVWLGSSGEGDAERETESGRSAPPSDSSQGRVGGRALVGMCVEGGPARKRRTASTRQRDGVTGLLDTHFAHSDAVRDFNEAMPVLVLPTGFEAQKGKLVASNPSDRLKEANDGGSLV